MKFTINGTGNGKELVIHEGATEISAEAFYNNQLESVTISNSVTYIGNRAFRYNNLNEVYIPNPDCVIGPEAFDWGVKIIIGE